MNTNDDLMNADPNELEHHIALGCAFTALVATLSDQGVLDSRSFDEHMAAAALWLGSERNMPALRAFDDLRTNLDAFLRDR